jgi:hypothetical protein
MVHEAAPLVCHRAFNFEAFILFLPDVQKERTEKDRQAEFDVEGDKEHAQETAPSANFQDLSGGVDDGRRQEQLLRRTDDILTRRHVFEDRLIGRGPE